MWGQMESRESVGRSNLDKRTAVRAYYSGVPTEFKQFIVMEASTVEEAQKNLFDFVDPFVAWSRHFGQLNGWWSAHAEKTIFKSWFVSEIRRHNLSTGAWIHLDTKWRYIKVTDLQTWWFWAPVSLPDFLMNTPLDDWNTHIQP